MEASEATPEAVEAEAQPEATDDTEQPQAPDVGEALQQLDQRFAALEERLPQEEQAPDLLAALTAPLEENEYEGEEQQPEQGEEGEDESAQFQQLLGEEVNRAVYPLYLQQEARQRTNDIQSYAAQHKAEFENPEIVDEMAARLQEAGLQPTDGTPPRADHVAMVHKAYIADAAASGSETPAEAGGEGATLETGAGPGAPEPEMSPEEQRWADAIKGNQNKSAFD